MFASPSVVAVILLPATKTIMITVTPASRRPSHYDARFNYRPLPSRKRYRGAA